MAEPTPALLADLLGSVLADAAFVAVEPAEEPATWPAPLYEAEIHFESVRGGSVRLVAPARCAVELAANMLGVDRTDPEAESHGRDAMAELVNVLGGSLVVRLYGPRAPNQLGFPATRVVQVPAPGRRTCAAAVRSDDGEPLLIELDLEEAVVA